MHVCNPTFILQVIEKMIRRNPFLSAGQTFVEISAAASDMTTATQEASSRKFTLQTIAHEDWIRVKGRVKGRIELQIRSKRTDGRYFIQGGSQQQVPLFKIQIY